MNWRLASRLSVITLALLVVLVVAFLGTRESLGGTVSGTPTADPSGLQGGTDLGGTAAPNFQLRDQNGASISLAQFKGKPLIVTFLYTHCPDVCPLTAEKLHTTMLQLGSDAQRVGVVAISVDPERDTQAAALDFSRVHKMTDYWHYLIGTHEQLSPVWTAYSVNSTTISSAAPTPAGTVMHTSAVYVIDKQGREQLLFDSDFTPTQLATDLKLLLK